MVAAPRSLLAFAAVATTAMQCTMATSLEYNPESKVADTVALDSSHPAFGSWVPNHVVEAVVKADPELLPLESLTIVEAPKPEMLASAPVAPPIGTVAGLGGTALVANTTEVNSQRVRRRLEASNTDLRKMEKHFGARMETNIHNLETSGEFKPAPWPSSYWPIYQDGINARWDENQAPPSEKYAKAFGLNVSEFMDNVSRRNGILSQDGRQKCSSDDDCSDLDDNSACGIREGESEGYCIPTWFGICHAWAPAAIMEPEPKCPVRKNGVTFQPFDIKALVTAVYDGAAVDTVFTGARYNGGNDAKDQWGRHEDPAYRDLGPGFFHIAFSNIMGRFKKSFVVDAAASAEVWNQPVRNYRVFNMRRVSLEMAGQYFYGTAQYPFNPRATSLAYVQTEFNWIVEGVENRPTVSNSRIDRYTKGRKYTYLLELDEEDNIIGGEWLYRSNDDHPDFLWFPTSRPAPDTVTDIGLSYKHVKELLDASIKARC
ncbi:TPA: hypothetical protein N0F65_006521 [Lagenidium giganteum]|uniref:Transglutaminase elicitor n=1 Tax=Lagenidium giganteum TaxID=4803 RepID=A0AAV2YJE6_9STRA|nr:TPA: hypothetical protein N0F65_006521 [Lagenidium giganteum]